MLSGQMIAHSIFVFGESINGDVSEYDNIFISGCYIFYKVHFFIFW